MRPASLNLSSLPILHLFLLLLGLQLPQALMSTTPHSAKVLEIWETLKNVTSPSRSTWESLNATDRETLTSHNLLRSNLEVFIRTAGNFSEHGLTIKKNLKSFRSYLPIPTSTVSLQKKTIVIKDNWDDFQNKLTYYLDYLVSFLKKTTNTAHGP